MTDGGVCLLIDTGIISIGDVNCLILGVSG